MVVELRSVYALIPTTFVQDNDFRLKTVAYPLFTPLEEWVPYVAHKFGLEQVGNFVLKVIGKQEGFLPFFYAFYFPKKFINFCKYLNFKKSLLNYFLIIILL